VGTSMLERSPPIPAKAPLPKVTRLSQKLAFSSHP
jgi:hypothetical protein